VLYISRKPGEGIKIGDITVVVVRDPNNPSRIRLCIDSPIVPVYKLERLPQESGKHLKEL